MRKPVRTSAWSSVMRTRMLMRRPPYPVGSTPARRSRRIRSDRRRRRHGRRTARGARACRPVPARRPRVSAPRRCARRRRRSRSSSASGAQCSVTVGACRPGVLERVGQRLLHDAVGGEVGADRQREALAVLAQRHVEAGVAGALDQRVELPPVSAGRPRCSLVLGHQAEHAPQLDERGAARSPRPPPAPARRARRRGPGSAARPPTGRPSPRRCGRRRRAARARSGGARRPPRRGRAPRARSRAAGW